MKNANAAQLIEPDKGKRNNRLWKSLAVAAGSAALFASGCGESNSGTGSQKELGPDDIEHVERVLDTPKEDLSDVSNPPADNTVSLLTGEEVSLDELEDFCQTEKHKAEERREEAMEEFTGKEAPPYEVVTALPYTNEGGEQKVYTCK